MFTVNEENGNGQEKRASLIFNSNMEENQDNFLTMLDEYCANILAYTEEPKAIFGSAVAMRKALEMLGAYFVFYHSKRKGGRPQITNGNNVFVSKLERNRTDPLETVALIPECVRGIKNIIFVSTTDDADRDKVLENLGINAIEHYQGYRTQKKKKQADVEVDYLIAGHNTMKKKIGDFSGLLRSLLSAAEFNENSYNEKEHLKRMLSLEDVHFQKVDEEIKRIEKSKKEDAASCWDNYVGEANILFSKDDKFRLNNSEPGKPRFSSLAADVVLATSRLIAEKSLYTVLIRANTTGLQNQNVDFTLSDYIDKVNRMPGPPEAEAWRQELVHSAIMIQSIANYRMHWQDETEIENALLCFKADSMAISYANIFEKELYPYTARMAQELVQDNLPKWFQEILRRDDEYQRKLEEALKNAQAQIEEYEENERKKQREIKIEHIKRIVITGFAAVLTVALIAVIAIPQYLNREIIHNYADYGWLDGELVGVTELDKEAASQRLHYRFVEQKGLLRRVEHVDGEGRIRNEYVLQSRPAAMQLRYGETEQLTEIVAYNEQGKELYQLKFNGDKDTTRYVEFYSAQGAKLLPLPMDVKNMDVYTWGDSYQKLTGIDSVQVMRQSAQSVRVSFARLDDSRSDSNYVSGMVYQYDAAGRLSEIRYEYDSGMMLDANTLVRRVLAYEGSVLTGWQDYSAANALMEYEYQYDETGRCVGIQYKDIITGLLTETQGVASETYDYNENGQRTGLHYLNKALEPVLSSAGYATHTWRYDGDGRLVEEAYYDTTKNLIVPDGGWARKAVTYDGAKELTSYFGADNKAVNIADADHKDYPYAKVQVEQNGSVRTVVRYDAEGKRVLFPGNVFEWRYTYDALGREIKAEAYGLNGQPVLAYNNYFMYEEKYNANGQKTDRLWYDTDGKTVTASETYHYNSRNLMDEMSRYTYQSDQDALVHAYTVQYKYNEKALEIRIEYRNEQGGLMPCPGSVIAVIETKYNQDGDIEERCYLDEKEQLVNYPSIGYAKWVAEYENGHRTKISQYGEDGGLTVASNGYAVERIWYDDAGNELGWAFYDEKDQPTINPKEKCAAVWREFDDRGNITKDAWYDVDGNLTPVKDDVYAMMLWEYDDAGRYTRVSFYDKDEQPVISRKYGYATERREYDSKGRILSYFDYDTEDNLMITKYGDAGEVNEYDKAGNNIRKSYYNEKNELMIHPSKGYAVIRTAYDEAGRVIEEALYDENDQLMIHKKYGCAIRRKGYDELGNMVNCSYYDKNGTLIVSPYYGCASWTAVYDERGHELEAKYYDAQGQLMRNLKDGYAVIRKTYDEAGNLIEWRYYDTNEQLMPSPRGGYSIGRSEYNEMGNTTKESYFDANDQLVLHAKEGYAVLEEEYDNIGRMKKWSHYDTEGHLAISETQGYASCQRDYDENGNVTKITIYGTDGNLMVSPVFGYAVQKSEFDGAGHETVTRYFNENEQPMLHPEYGYASVSRTFDENGNETSFSYFDENGQSMLHPEYGYATVQKDYNNAGKAVETRYYDTQGNLMISAKYGYAILRSTYDEKGQEIAWSCFDENEQPMLHPEYGYASASRIYDEAGNAVEIRCYDTQGQLTVSPKLGYAILRSTYDEKGQEIAWVHLDENEQPLLLPEFGYASVSRTFDENGNETSFSYFDENGQPMLHPEYGYATVQKDYNNAGKVLETRYYDTQGNLMIPAKYGYAVLRSTYDGKGQEIAWAYFDENEQPILHPEYGYASASRTYDEAGNAVEIRYYDTQGQLTVSPKNGYAVLRSTYDEKGQEIAWVHLDENEQPLLLPEFGYASVSRTFDENGNETSFSYFDENGRPMLHPEYGYATIRKVYDDEGHVVEESYYDEDGQLIGLPGSGSAMIQRVYEGGKLAQSTSYNQAGDKMNVYRYDENEKMLEQTVYHEGGDYTVYEYGADGRAEYWHHYDAEGNLAAISDLGNAGGRYYHDEDGRTYAEDFYNEENVPFLRRENDEEGNAVEWIDLDEQGNPLQKEEEAS